MFHVVLVLPIFIMLGVFISIILFSIFMFVLSIVGGASTALLVKNKTYKKLLFTGLCIVSFIGLVSSLPIIALYAGLSAQFLMQATVAAFVCIAILGVAGIRFAAAIENKIVKTVLVVVFGLVCAAAVSLAVLFPVLRQLLFKG